MWQQTLDILNRGELTDFSKRCFPVCLMPEPDARDRDARHCMAFHFAMWLGANPDVTHFKVMADGATILSAPVLHISGVALWVLFGNEKDRDAFTTWLDQYKTWFDGKTLVSSVVPDLPQSGRISISIVNTPFARCDLHFGPQQDYPDGFFERWTWVIQNCKSPVYVMPTRGLGFTDEQEGMMYKLTWGQ